METVEARAGVRPFPLVAALVLGGAAVLFAFDPDHWNFYPECVFHRATGLLCPGCGSLRAVHHLLHGQIGTALRCNPLLFLTLAAVGILSVRVFLRSSGPRRAGAWAGLRPVWLWVYLGIVLVFWVARNLPGPVFSLLRP